MLIKHTFNVQQRTTENIYEMETLDMTNNNGGDVRTRENKDVCLGGEAVAVVLWRRLECGELAPADDNIISTAADTNSV